ncbi:hypothetical protein ACOMHN_049485 [Nucella lapillus]
MNHGDFFKLFSTSVFYITRDSVSCLPLPVLSEVSNLNDSAYTSCENGKRPVSLKMKKMAGQQEAAHPPSLAAGSSTPARVDSNGALIRDFLQAFVSMANARGAGQVPVSLPPQLLAQYGAHLPPLSAQQAVYAISQGTVPASTLPSPAPSTSPVAGQSMSPPGTPHTASPAASPQPRPQPAAPGNGQITTEAQINAHVNPAYQED